jgi:hypothetical protein
MRIAGILLTLFFSIPAGYAQVTQAPAGARAAGVGGITTVLTDVWSASGNPGALGLWSGVGVGVSHEQRFAMPEWGVSSLVGAFSLGGNGVGLALSNVGLTGFGENHFGLSVGRKLNAYIAMGVGVNGHLLHFSEDYRNLFAVIGKVGVWAQPAKKLTLGFYVVNVTFSKWNSDDSTPLPVIFSLGACYHIATPVQLYAELTKDIYEALRLRIGTEFSIRERLFLRVGVVSQPFEMHFGIGYSHKRWQFDVALSRHPVLGYSPTGGICFRL